MFNCLKSIGKLSTEVRCAVVFMCCKRFMDHVRIFIALNVSLFHLLLPDN